MWTFAFSPNDFTAISVTVGTAASASGKTITCNSAPGNPGQYTCLAIGWQIPNATVIPDGTIAIANFTVSTTTSSTASSIQVLGISMSDPPGNTVVGVATGSIVTIATGQIAPSGLSCNPQSVSTPNLTQCTVTLSGPAPAGGFPVSIGFAASSAIVSVQTSVTVPQGSTSATFPVQISSATTLSPVQVSATANSVTATFSIGLVCSYGLSSLSTNVPTSGGTQSVNVATQSGCAWTAASNSAFLTIISGASGTASGAVSYAVAADAGPARTGTLTIAGQAFTVSQGAASLIPTKVGVFLNGPVWLDTNGNLRYDPGVDVVGSFGAPGDILVTGDWTGDGTTKIGIFRPSTGLWALDMNGDGVFEPGIDKTGNFGLPGDVPIVGDWTGNGITKIGVFRPSTASFALDSNGNLNWDQGIDAAGTFGLPGDVPIVGDWTGDGRAKVGIFRQGFWALDTNANLAWDPSTDKSGNFGIPGDSPLIGDWTGDGRAKIGIYRASAAVFALDLNDNLAWDFGIDQFGAFGIVGDTPVVGDWAGVRIFRIGIFRPSTGFWMLDINGSLSGASAQSGYFGAIGGQPLVGRWHP